MNVFSIHRCLLFFSFAFLMSCGSKSSPTKPQPGPPVISPVPNQRIDPKGQSTPLDLDDFVTDPDDPDADITWSVGGDSLITVTIDAEHRVVFIAPSDGSEVTEVITFTATDKHGFSASLSVRVTVAKNRPPSVSRTVLPMRLIATWEEGFPPILLDDIVEDPDNTDAEITWKVSGASHLQLSIDERRVAHIVPPEPGWLGAERVTFTAMDPGGFADSLSLTIGMGPRSPTGKVYVANTAPYKAGYGNPASGDIMEIDIATNTVGRSFPAGDIPFYMVPSSDGRLLYVVNRGLEYHPDTHIAASRIWTIDLTSGAKVGDISTVGKNPGWFVLSSDERTAYVIISVKQGKETIPQGKEGISEGVVAIDLVSGQITATFPLRGYPVGLCAISDRSRLFVTNVGIVEGPILVSAPLSLIDTGTGWTTEVELKNSSYGICLSSDERTAYVTKPPSGVVEVVDVIGGVVIADIRVNGSPQRIVRSPDGKRLYVPVRKRYKDAPEPNTLVVIDTATNSITQTVEVGPGPEGVAVTPEGRFIYVTNRNYIHGSVTQGSVTVIDAVDNTVIATIPVGEEPIAVCTVTD